MSIPLGIFGAAAPRAAQGGAEFLWSPVDGISGWTQSPKTWTVVNEGTPHVTHYKNDGLGGDSYSLTHPSFAGAYMECTVSALGIPTSTGVNVGVRCGNLFALLEGRTNLKLGELLGIGSAGRNMLGSAAFAYTAALGVKIKLHVGPDTLKAKAWLEADPEPGWLIDVPSGGRTGGFVALFGLGRGAYTRAYRSLHARELV